MNNPKNISSRIPQILFALIAFCVSVAVFVFLPPQAVDWHRAFYKVSFIPLHPYDELYFINPPWTALILYPFHFFPANISLAINSSLTLLVFSLLVLQRKGDKISLLLTLTSYPLMSAIANGNVEWIPAIGFLLQNAWGVPFLLAKPQSGIVAALAWASSFKKAIPFFIAGVVTVLLSFLIWGNWIADIQFNIQSIGIYDCPCNISIFPWAVPVGLGIIFYMLKYNPDNREILGTLATFCIIPYFGAYSLTVLFALISARYRKIALVLWILLWIYPFAVNWRALSSLLAT